jgi:hypothetical protein
MGVAEDGEADPRHRVRRCQQPEQQVLGADVIVVQFAGLILRADYHLARLPGESFKHVFIMKTLSIHYF